MLELIEGLPKNVVGIAASGKVTMQDCQDVLVPAIERSRRRHDKIRLYYELNSRFPGSAWDDLDLGLEHASCCERVAIVTDIGWVRLTVKAVRFLIPSEIRVFTTDRAEEGRAWVSARPGSRADVDNSQSAGPGLLRPQRMRDHPRRARQRGLPENLRRGTAHPRQCQPIKRASNLKSEKAHQIADRRPHPKSYRLCAEAAVASATTSSAKNG